MYQFGLHKFIKEWFSNFDDRGFDKLIWYTIGPKSFFFDLLSLVLDGTVNCDYIVTNSINSLLIG